MFGKQVAEVLASMSETQMKRLMVSDANPFMSLVKNWAELARTKRKPASRGSFFTALERLNSGQIVHALTACGQSRDNAIVKWVESFYGPFGLGAVLDGPLALDKAKSIG